jgi:tetratricopeptide (TPR) repeat protein
VTTDEIKSRYLRDIEYFSKKIEQIPNSKCYYPLAFAYLQLQKFDDVIEICEKGLEKHPDYMQLATLMGEAFLRKGLQEEARAILESVIQTDSFNFRALKLLGDIYRNENKPVKAIEFYKKAFKLSPESEELKKILDEFEQGQIEATIEENNVDDKYAIDADLDKIMDDIFKNVNVPETSTVVEEESAHDFSLEESLKMINQLTNKNKNVDNLMNKHISVSPNEKVIIRLNAMLQNVERIKKERQLS